MKALLHVGRTEKIERIVGSVLRGDSAMVRHFRRFGFETTPGPDDDLGEAELVL